MKYKILLTSTSFQDIPGRHHELFNMQGFDVTRLRGPLKEHILLGLIDQYDGLICGDDEITRAVIEKGKAGKLKIISKYGTGLDKVDVKAAFELGIPVTNCPGVNQVAVAEHVFALLLSFVKNIVPESEHIRKQQWVRLIGTELSGKTMGILGMGNVGKEVAKRATAFGMKVIGFDLKMDENFASAFGIDYVSTADKVMRKSDIISLNMSLNEDTEGIINQKTLTLMKKGVIIVNTARAGLVRQDAIVEGIKSGIIKGYLTDVLEEEPMMKNHPFLNYDQILITPHIASRTYENVKEQATISIENLLKHLNTNK